MTCSADILELFDLVPDARRPAPVGSAAQELLTCLRDGPLTADELVRAAGIEPAEVSAALIELELAGDIALEDGVYQPTIEVI